jgi:hypothetical protein
MFREKHFTDYARRVAEADAGEQIGRAEAPGLAAAPDLDALRQSVAPKPTPRPPAAQGWIGNERRYLEPEPRNRDYGGYRPAVGKYADPAEEGAEWQGKTPPPGEAPKP